MKAVLHYPHDTLSRKYLLQKQNIEEITGEAMRAEYIGKEKYPSPKAVLDFWFTHTFSNPKAFFCCQHQHECITELTDLLTHVPLHCLFIARVTMTESTSKKKSEREESDETVVYGSEEQCIKKYDERHGGRSQSVVDVSGDPPAWIEYKNRKNILFHQATNARTASVLHQPNVKKRKRNMGKVANEGSESNDSDTDDPDPLSTHMSMGDQVAQKRDENCPQKKKLHSKWTLYAYITLNPYNFTSEEVNGCKREILHSKGIYNRVNTACMIALRYKVPIWLSEDVIKRSANDEKTNLPNYIIQLLEDHLDLLHRID